MWDMYQPMSGAHLISAQGHESLPSVYQKILSVVHLSGCHGLVGNGEEGRIPPKGSKYPPLILTFASCHSVSLLCSIS